MDSVHSLTEEEKRALLKRLLKSPSRQEAENEEAIAVIGVAGRYPRAANIEEFWQNLKEGRNCTCEVPSDRWDGKRLQESNPEKPGAIYTRWGGFIDDVDKFDPLFFNISPLEAEAMDPQERIFLETAWAALEDAGYTRKKLGRLNHEVGVFVGVMNAHYEWYNAEAHLQGKLTGAHSHFWSNANRLSYFLNLNGPSFAVDSACSSSLTAIHLACTSLQRAECRAAIAGGVNLILHPLHYHKLCMMGMLSREGANKSFANGADGFVDGEGAGAILLKRLREAEKDGDRIYAVIKAGALNAGGKTSGYTVPNPGAQKDLIVRALRRARVDARDISYVEAHGTGTSIGDPIEHAGLTHAFREFTGDRHYCALGSVKSNIGHLESAAGVAGLTKVILQLQHRLLVPSINADELNPKIDFEDSPFVVQRKLEFWQPGRPTGDFGGPRLRRAGLSSFGAGGANAHVILEEYPSDQNVSSEAIESPQIIVLSARREDRLREYAGSLADFLRKKQEGGELNDSDLRDIAFTLQTGREPMDSRLAFVARSLNEVLEKLRAFLEGQSQLQGVYHGLIDPALNTANLIGSGEAGRLFLETLISQNELPRLAKLWISGVEIDWEGLPADKDRQIISLPTYPFARERHWIQVDRKTIPSAFDGETLESNTNIVGGTEDNELVCFAPRWEAIAEAKTVGSELPKCALLFGSEDAANQLRCALEVHAAPTTVISVLPGVNFARVGEKAFRVNPRKAEEYPELIAALHRENQIPESVLYFADFAQPAVANDEEAEPLSMFGLFHLTKSWQRRLPGRSVRYLYVYRGDSEGRTPCDAAPAGLLKTVALEDPNVKFKCLEVSQAFFKEPDSWHTLVLELGEPIEGCRELRRTAGTRQEKAWVQIASPRQGKVILQKGAVYIITGGLGGLGKLLATHLAKNWQAKLVLAGRSEIDETGNQLLEKLRGIGAEAAYIRADVSTRPGANFLVSETRERFGAINGLFHAAGIIQDDFLLNKEWTDFAKVLAPKMLGAQFLDESTRNEHLDFVVFFSSLSGVWGNVGQADYSAANTYLDRFADYRNELVKTGRRFGRSLSVNWPQWLAAGMQMPADHREVYSSELQLELLPEDHGFRILEELLESSENQALVLYGKPAGIERLMSGKLLAQRISGAIRAKQPALLMDEREFLGRTETFLRKLVAESIKLPLEQLEVNRRFEEYGFDSVIVRAFNRKIEKELGPLPKTLLFQCSNLQVLTEYLVTHHREQLRRFFDGTTHSSGTRPSEGEHEIAAVSASPSLGGKATAPSERKIAVIGLAGRYPLAPDVQAFWHNLKEGRDCITDVPPDRWDYREYYDPDASRSATGKIYCKSGGFLADADRFDPLFFGISPVEAEAMDPQERLFLEVVWEAFENAGYTRPGQEGNAASQNVGVFVGITTNSYLLWGAEAFRKGQGVIPSSLPWSLANRVSFLFDFHGPSMPVDTACSSSLTAIHMACESLRKGECEMAVAGGVNLYLHPLKYLVMCQARMLSCSGRCHSFGEGGDGFIPGEGVGAVLLKPLAQAEADGDLIHGVIVGTAVNHGGRTNGYTIPNPRSHAELILSALDDAEIDPRTVSYIEAHGTGTTLGDPIEIEGLAQAFRTFTLDRQFCAIGSVKSVIGHLESAAGIAGLTKVLLQMKHGCMVPSLHAESLNPNIDFARSPFFVQREATPWHRPKLQVGEQEQTIPRRAGISSFGAGGANAHILVEEYDGPAHSPSFENHKSQIFILSARDAVGLRKSADKLRAYLGGTDEKWAASGLENIAFSLQVGREAMTERLAVCASTFEELQRSLDSYLCGDASSPLFDRGRAGRDKPDHPTPEALDAAIRQRDLSSLAKWWVSGASIQWHELYKETSAPHRVALPSYPFTDERYWFDTAKAHGERSGAPEASRLTAGSEAVWYTQMPPTTGAEYKGTEVGLEILDGSIALVTMQDSANRNMFSETLLRGLLAKFTEIHNNPEIRAVVITGCGKVFSMGGTQEGLLGLVDQKARFTDVPFLYKGFLECPIPVVAAMQGHASGGGFLFGLYADFVVLAKEAVYVANFLEYGFTPGMGATLILPEKLGRNLASEMMLTARSFLGDELQRRGASVVVCEASSVLDEAFMIARLLAQRPLPAVKELKRALAEPLLRALPEALEKELAMHARTLLSAEVREKVEAHFRKTAVLRSPQSSLVGRAVTESTKIQLRPLNGIGSPGEIEKGASISAGAAAATEGFAASASPTETPVSAVSQSESVEESEVQATILEILNRLLHLPKEKVDLDASFSALGVDSISAVEIMRDINRTFHCQLDTVMIYDHPTVEKLAAFVKSQCRRPQVHRELPMSQPVQPDTNRLQNGVKPVAIIGISCRFPGAPNKETFWQNLERGIDSVDRAPADRLGSGIFEKEHQGASAGMTEWRGGFLEEIDKFDADFFKILPVEAEYMEPQQRMFLEECWKALEDAGYSNRSLATRRCGVFVGATTGDYLTGANWEDGDENLAHAFTGGSPSILAARIAYHLDLTGPSVALDTACSSSLVAIHQACLSLFSGDCELALAGGVSVMITPRTHLMTRKAGMLSPTGKCRPFDQRADGIAISEGIGVVVLKPLDQAIKDSDVIYGVIQGSAVNQDGKTNGITAPSVRSQILLQQEVYRRAGIQADDITYVEAHGTGTPLGDPIEVKALTEVFSGFTSRKQFSALGSVKGNIGHTMLAAGVAGLIKVLLALKHHKIPASLHFNTENEHLKLKETPFYVNTDSIPWPPGHSGKRIAAVSSFGFSGTNAHLLLEEWSEQEGAREEYRYYPLLVSARSQGALTERLRDLRHWLGQNQALYRLGDIAFTLHAGRSHFRYRCALVVRDVLEITSRIDELLSEGAAPNCWQNSKSPTPVPDLAPEETIDICKRAWESARTDETRLQAAQELAKAFIAGIDLPYEHFYGAGKYHRISMPPYPFDRRSYWLPGLRHFDRDVSTDRNKGTLPPDRPPEVNTDNGDRVTPELIDLTLQYVKEIFAEKTKLEPAALDVESDFEDYGLDSIVIAQLNRRLESDIGKLPASLFFKYKSIAAVAGYLATEHSESLRRLSEGRRLGKTGAELPDTRAPSALLIDIPAQKSPGESAVEGIAIIGMSGRFPMAHDLETFWQNLERGKDCITEIPRDRWDYRKYQGAGDGKREGMYCKWGGFIEDADKFDAKFFNISPREARFMDPQERIFLEGVWSCIEDAGYTRETLADEAAGDGRSAVGVFGGITLTDYQIYGGEAWGRGEQIPVTSQIYALTNRVSYYFNFRGPSLAVDTACSSSLFAVHLACECLRNGECTMALAGGVNLSLHPNKYLTLCLGQFAASDGRCHAFSESGDGYVPGEGLGVVLLKPLKQAVRDKDHIYAVIRGTAVNHDGKTHGFTVPNPTAQSEVITAALEKAGINPETINYVEAHGTGTALGDPIEITGLTDAYSNYTKRRQYCAIGSVKSNIGHLEAAAGIAQLIKVVLQLKHRTIVPTLLHSSRLNPYIDFPNTPFYVHTETSHWDPVTLVADSPSEKSSRRAGVSAFGVGGVNVHAIVEEYCPPDNVSNPPNSDSEEQDLIVPLSAKSERSLEAYVGKLADYIRLCLDAGFCVELTLADLAYTIQVGREAMPVRLALVAGSLDSILEKLDFVQKFGLREAAKTGSGIFYCASQTRTGRQTAPDGRKDGAFSQTVGANHDVGEIARFWTEGATIDWRSVPGRANGRRISLPTYVFEKERYWQFERGEPAASSVDPDPITPAVKVVKHQAQVKPPIAGRTAEALTVYLREIVGELLGFVPPARPSIEEGLFDMGIDSVQVGQLLSRVHSDLGVELYATVIFDYPSIQTLADYIAGKENSSGQERLERVTSRAGAGPTEALPSELLYCAQEWIDAPFQPHVGAQAPALPDGDFLLLETSEAGSVIRYALADRIQGRRVISVRPGYEFEEKGDDVFVVDPRAADHFCRLFQILQEQGCLPKNILHCWSDQRFSANSTVLGVQLEKGPYSIFHLTQALMKLPCKDPVRLLYVVRSSGNAFNPIYSAIGGLVRTVHQENPNYDYKMVEVREFPESANHENTKEFANLLLRELALPGEQCREIRYNLGVRQSCQLREIDRPVGAARTALRDKGVYLISGGAGGLGSIFAEYLARRMQARLVLSGRSALSPETEALLRRLESLGAEAMYVSADVGNRSDAERLVAAAKTRFGSISGVLHAAGLLRDAFIPKKTVSEWHSVLKPKIYGGIYLDEATATESLDFFVLFSSLSSFLGSAGQSDYSYANSFLNHYAALREQWRREGKRSGKSAAIAWPLWKGGGMKIDRQMEKFLRETIGLDPLPENDGLQIFESTIGATAESFAVLRGRRDKIRNSLKIELRSEWLDPQGGSMSGSVDGMSEEELEKTIEAELEEVSAWLDQRAQDRG